jgi:hypothetical protein
MRQKPPENVMKLTFFVRELTLQAEPCGPRRLCLHQAATVAFTLAKYQAGDEWR